MSDLANDPRSIDDLFQATLLPDNDTAWNATGVLQLRGTEEILERCITLSRSKDAKERARAADVLGQLGCPDRTFPDQCFDSLLELLRDEDFQVVSSAIMGLQHLDRIRAASQVLPFAGHQNDDVRYAVAVALGCIDSNAATAALLVLMQDRNEEVRDWATFGIGQQSDADSENIRTALADRLTDDDADVRYEATLGLGRRGDKRALEPLIAILNTDPDDIFAREASANFLGFGGGENASTSDILAAMKAFQQ